MNLILLRRDEASADGACRVDDERARHMTRVLHVGPGSVVRIGQIDGPFGTAVVERVDGDAVDLVCTFEASPPPRPQVDLLLALPRPKVMRRLWAQLAALGVHRILLTNAERVERNYFDTHVLTPAGYEPLLIEGLQQARDTWLPHVTIHRQLKVLVEDEIDALCPETLRLIADPGAHQPAAAIVESARERRVLLAVGPEGGWNDFERRLLAARGFQPLRLGGRTLRTDTACVALLALVHDALRTHRPPPKE